MSDPKFGVGDIVFTSDEHRVARIIEIRDPDPIFSGGRPYLIEYLTGQWVGPNHRMLAGEAALITAEEL